MSADVTGATPIPARVSVKGLAASIGVDVSEVQAVLRSRGEPWSEDDMVSGLLGQDVSKALGLSVYVEPRDQALELLYQAESGGQRDFGTGAASAIATGVLEGVDEIDGLIEDAAEHWSVARMPVLDRNVLRIAVWELENTPDTPSAVIISEAVRLAQTYSTERSSSFVNGVLATLARNLRG